MSEPGNILPFIDRGIDYPVHQHYQTLLDEGITRISAYSGEVWTNYNDSDPGITMLQNLCYALTELGFKTDLPIEDLLTGKNGKIKYNDHFHVPEDILPMNPATLDDFRKLLLSHMPEVKQVYIDPTTVAGLVNAWSVYLEVKPGHTAGITLARSSPLIARANALLRQHENIGQPFVTRFVLQPLLLQLSGTITLSGSGADEQTVARMIIAFNHVLSPYPQYHTYAAMAAQGMRYDQLLEGPWLPGGYIPDAALVSKRHHLSVDELNAALLPIPGISSFNSLAIRTNSHKAYATTSDFEQDTAPYVSWESFKDVIILVGGQQWTSVNENKLSYYIRQFTPQPVDNPRAQIALPHGVHRDIKKYYSIQHNFPAAYRLAGSGPADKTAQAQVKQLKAYLALFEQNLADHLAQLASLGSLFDFDSGSTTTQLAGRTYHTQPLYDVPGIRKVLKDAEDVYPDWTAYKNDSNNPYIQELEHIHRNPLTDMKRKKRLLEHLLARYGQSRDPRYLPFVNPAYGNDATAEVGSLSDTLRAVSSLTADRARTYFMHHDHRFPVTGMELRLENILGLKSYYRGVIEAVRNALRRDEGVCLLYYTTTGPITVYGTPPPKKRSLQPPPGTVEVYWSDDLMLTFATDTPPEAGFTAHQALEYVMPSLAALRILCASNGLVLIDHAQLLRYQSFRWTVYDTDGHTALFETPELYYEEMIEDLSLITGDLPFYAEVKSQDSYQVTVRSSQVQYVLCDDVPTRAQADAIIRQLTLMRKNGSSPSFSLKVISTAGEMPFPANGFHQQITLLFPAWVAAMNHNDYRQFILEKVISIAPAHVVSNVCFATLDELEALLPPYRQWLHDVRLMNQLDFQHHFDNNAAFQVLKQLVDKKV